jgi:hypothetical protein
MYEVGKPWCVWHYNRPDWVAMILGGLIEGECLICGEIERLHLGWWAIWFPPKSRHFRHPKRDDFISRHMHTEKQRQNKIMWARPLTNPFGL